MSQTTDKPDRLAGLSPAKRQLLLKMLQKQAAGSEGERAIPRREEDGPSPLSFSQQRLWFLDRLTPGSPAYNIVSAVRLRGALRPEVLRQALNEVVRRHEVLRARFAEEVGQPVQIVAPELDVPLPLVDLRTLPDAGGATRDLAREETLRPFDLGRGPLLRALLLRRAADDHVVLFTLHHIVTDGWSMGVLTREVGTLYRAFAAGLPSPLPELPLQFADYAAWQRQWLQGEVLAAQLAWWREKLAGAPAVLELPTDRPRPSVPDFRGASRDRMMGTTEGGLSAALGALTRGGESTLFMVLLAAFEALLGRYSRQDDVVVGSPVANRNRPGLESLIGFFVNTLPLRVRLDGDPTFRQLLDRARETTLGAYEHQDLPFERLVDELGLERSLSHSPLFQVVLSLQNTPEADPGPADGLAISALPTESSTAKFDLLLGVGEAGGRLATSLEYRTDLFDDATVDRLLGHLETLLTAVAADPEARVWEVPLLAGAERAQLLDQGGARESYPLAGSLADRFAARAAATPAVPGVSFEGETLSYGELDRRANRLANRLLEAGVAPGSRVCLALERGLGLVEGILGILKAGCAYVPLDPSYPQERLAWVLEDAGAAALVTTADQLGSLPAWTGRTLLLGESGGSDEAPRVAAGPEWPAYVIYTSGSTGRPKGVVVSHGNVLRLMDSTDGWFGFGPHDVWTLFHSYAFDFSVWEIWGALLYGGRLVVVPYLVSRSPEAMLELLDREGVTVLNQTPSAFRALQQVEAERPEPAACGLRWIVFGGEALEPRGLETWWRRHGGEAGPGFINMYGITETTVHVTWRRLGEAEILGGGGSVIGIPLRDLAVHVLDPWGEPVPVGVAGEMHVGGAGVALGYLGRPELTAERFVPDPFGGAGARLYRSGDLARWRNSGELEYLGRIDFQVKVRGFRIELGEIEAALLQQPGIAAAVVLMREDRPGDRRLVAYVVGREEAAPAVEELRSRLQERLPDYMVPAAFVLLDALPLTPNGKVDRRALPAPGGDRPEMRAEYVAPRTPVEEVLAAIWSQVLGIERIGVRDNFFALGGDSILSLRVVALAGERGLETSLQDLFQRQTIAELAESIRRRQGPSETVRSEPFGLLSPEDRAKLPEDVEDAYPLAALQAGMLYHMELTPEDPQYQNVDSWQLRGIFEPGPFAEALRRVIARHPMLRTSFAMTGYSEPLQLVHRHAEPPLTVEDLRPLGRAEQDAAIDALVAREKRRPVDLAAAPQLRFHVGLRSEKTFQLTLTENHAIFDGWSLNSTLAEIFELYFELLHGADPAPAPPLALTYREFVRLEREALASPEAAGYWQRLLSEAEPVELPLWPADRRAAESRVLTQEIALPAEVAAGLQRVAREAAAPLKSVLLAAHAKVLSLLAGRPDVVGGLVMNGRLEESEGDQVRGLFLNTPPLRLRLPEGSWRDLVRAAFRAEQEMLPHRRYPFSALQRQWGQRPLYEIAFNYIHFHVVDALIGSGNLEVLDFRRVEPTNLGIHLVFSRVSEAGITGHMDFDARRFAPAQMRLLAGWYERALAALAEDAGAPHGSLLSPAERQAVLFEWSDTQVERPRGALIHELIAGAPEAVAVSQGEETVTYAGLAARANRLARRLRHLGVGPETRVAVCLERTPELVVALLAVLRAGGAYVPLDPAHPAERTAMVLKDSGAAVLLTEERWLDSLPDLPNHGTVLCLDRDRERIAAESAEPLRVETDEESLAYVIFTSGSTGRPKGVQLPHRAVVNFLLAMAERPGISARDVVPALTTVTFDIAGLEIWLPLLAGARVEMIGREEATDGARLAARLAACGATLVQATPATWRMLIDSGWKGDPAITALCGGEALPRDLAEALRERVGALWNVYGPTETAVWSSAGEVRDGDGPVTLGPPIANTRFHVVDREGGLVPVGVPGELWIGGDGLARGYLGRPDLTAERFAPDPFGGGPGDRVYRTGDLVRYRPEGELEFLGRIDFQVKVRGYRIELGEIEAALARHPAVAQTVVVARDDGAGQRLVAYLIEEEQTAVAELRAFLQQSLPDYMLPAAFVSLPAFPLTPSGKIDRKALPAPAATALAEGASYVAPKGPVEELLAGIWAEVLRVERIGASDGFFELGGHSLLATQVMSRIRAALGVELPLQRLFEAPTVRALARAVEAAREEREGVRLPPLVPLPRDARRDELPLSFSQERMWFLQQVDPDSTAYNLPLAVRLRGPLDTGALERAFDALAARHETLRTVFRLAGGSPVQTVLPPGPFPVARFDLRSMPEAGREAEMERLAGAESSRPFDLTAGPLLRAALIALGEDDHALVLVFHHIIADGWSWRILIRELAALYQAFATGGTPELPPLPVQYADFAVWQRRALAGEVLEAELGWWRERLGGSPPPLLLPADRRRSAGQGFRALAVGVDLPPELVRGLKALARRESASLYMTLLAGWNALLARATAQEDLLLGAPIANRNRVETEGLIGFFLNTLMLRTDASGDPAFRELVGRARETALGAFAHQDLPLEAVLQGAGWERDAGRTTPFQVMFLMQNLPRQERVAAGLSFSTVTAEHQGVDLGNAAFEVGLTLTEADDESLSAAVTYNGRLFDEATMVRLLERYRHLLAAAVADPGLRLWEIGLLSAEERSEVLAGGPAPEGTAFVPVHRRIADQAARDPEAPAVVHGGAALSYGELDARVRRLARHLAGLGIGPESVVGVALERSPDLIVALLAVLVAGAAYVPLDTGYPEERLAYILEDARAAALVSTSAALERLPGLAARAPRTIDLAALPAGPTVEIPETPVAPESLAYLIYTSGSTGRPKGVMVPHGALANYVDAFREEHGMGPADRVLQFASISFDTSAEEIYPCLSAGAALVLRDDAMLGSAEEFLDACRASGITLLDLPTAFWHGLVDRLAQSALALPESLRRVIIGGERALPERVAAWREAAPERARLFNTYGPTETTIVATRADLTAGPFDPAAEVPIGGPVRGARAWVLDPALELAPPGFPGELWVGGAGVARGYAGRPDLTAERFLPDPFGGQPGARLYRTGDLVRQTRTGELEFLGRIDQQVKIRGFRVELREVEAALAQHPAVAEAVVTAREDRPGDRRLAAYVVPRAGEMPPAQELRSFLADRLPDFMMPAAFVTLEALPLTPSGKVDRRALPAPSGQERSAADFVAPRTDSEEILAGIWSDLLGVERVGAHDDFFALGGHSLLLPQLLYRLRAAFQVEVPLRRLFEETTLERMALMIEEVILEEIEKAGLEDGEAGPRSLVEITPGDPGSRPPFFCVHPVGGDVLGFFPLARLLGPEQPFYALRAPGLEDERDPLAGIAEMAEEYLAEIRALQPAGPYRLGGWSLGGLVAFEMARRLREQGEETALLVVMDTGPGWPEGLEGDPRLEDEADPSQQLLIAAGYFQGLRGVDLGLRPGDLEGRPAGEQIRLFADRLRSSGLMHAEDTVEQVRRFLRVYRAGVHAYRAYRPGPYPGPLTVIRAAANPAALTDLGWSAVTGSPVDALVVPGNHVTMFAEPDVRVLAEALQARLVRAAVHA